MIGHIKWLSGLVLVVFFLCNTVHSADELPILIGATTSLEGKYVEPSMMGQEAFKLWAKEINKKGGLLGRQVHLVLYNDKSDIGLTRQLYTRLIEEDKVDLVLSPYSTPLTLAASEISERHSKLMLAIAAAAEKPWQGDARYLFQVYAPAKRQFVGLLDIMAKKGCRTVSVIYDDNSVFNLDIVRGVEEWAKAFKIEIALEKSYHDGKKELPALLAEVKAVNSCGLINSSYPPDSYELLRLLDEMNYRPDVLAMPIVPVHPDFQQKVGSIANLIFGPSQWEPDERIPFPGTKQFIVDFQEFTGHMPSFHAASAYAACQLYEQAIKRTQTLDNDILRDYIAALDTVTVLGRFKVDPSGLQVGHNSIIIQWQNGKKEIVWPQKMQTAKPIF
ncbi:MAG: amino acid ABC transporter substrate-binding protein [Desulfopila sp.]|nr:amino acid ABC transporter substrate-binding protein [Desulfopila sp.]